MANIQFKDFATATLSVGIGAGDVSLTVTGGQGARFPTLTGAQYFYAVLENAALVREVVKVTARTTDVMTVVRAQGGTTAVAWSAGDSFALRLTSLALKAVLDVEDNAAASAATALGAQSSATTSANTAITQAGIATTQAGIATTQASNAATSASTATTQAGIATTQASNAASSAAAAAASYDSFDDRYLGAKPSDPSVDNDGNALLTGASYWHIGAGELRFWSGSAWLTANLTPSAYLPLTGGTLTGSLGFSGTGNRITGDFSNATLANRVMFQTSTVNGNTSVSAIPNGTGAIGQFQAYGGSDPANTSRLTVNADVTNSRCYIGADALGTGSYLPLTFYTGGSERVSIGTNGGVQALTSLSVGSNAPGATDKFLVTQGADFTIGTDYAIRIQGSGYMGAIALNATSMQIGHNSPSRALTFHSGTSFAERFRIGASGQLGIGGANYGTSGQVLVSGGASAAPSWATPSAYLTFNAGSGISTNTTLTSSDYGKFIYLSGTFTLTLPVAAAGDIGKTITVYAYTTATVTVATQSSQPLYYHGESTATSAVLLGAGSFKTFVNYSGAGWMAIGSSEVGIGQSWQAVTRAPSTTYYNTTGRPIVLATTFTCSASGGQVIYTINGVAASIGFVVNPSGGNYTGGANAIIPAGASYSFTGPGTYQSAQELR